MRQSGQLSPTLIIAAVGVLTVVGSIGYAKLQSSRLEAVKQEFTAFQAQVKANGEAAEREKQRKEAENAKSIKDAMDKRNAALGKLRDANTTIRQLSDNTAATSSSGYVCLPTATYNAAMGQFRKSLERGMADARGIATEGDEAQIDSKALLESWPK